MQTWMQQITGTTTGYNSVGHWCQVAQAWRGPDGKSLTDGYEHCSNGIDDDGDGFTDYWDPACRENTYKQWCSYCDKDGIDNDYNGKFDGTDYMIK